MKRRGFTIIELLVVMGIIVLLGALLIVSLGYLIRSNKTQATNTDLASVHSMYSDVLAVNPTPPTPLEWLWRNLPAASPFPGPVATTSASAIAGGVPFWGNPIDTLDPRGLPNANIPDCLDAPPGALTSENPLLRNGSRVVLNTQLAMRVILSYPNNKAAFSHLPADRWMIPTWVHGSIIHSGTDGILGTPDDSTDTVVDVIYVKNNCVTDLDRSVTPPVLRTYRCILENVAGTPNEPSIDILNNPTHWAIDNDPTPILLDAWGNPIIFVPASGLIDVFGNVSVSPPVKGVPVAITSTGYLVKPDAGDTIAALPYEANRTPTYPSGGRYLPPIQAPDKRAFFVSTGPDGDLSTGDDNIYSFEK